MYYKYWLKNCFESGTCTTEKPCDQGEQHGSKNSGGLKKSLLNLFPRVFAAEVEKPVEAEHQSAYPYDKSSVLYERYKHTFEFSPENETGADRVREYYRGMLNGYTGESSFVMETFGIGCVIGFVYGVTIDSRLIVQNFIRQHNEMTFEGEYLAKRKLHDYVFIQCIKKGFKTTWRAGLFPAMFSVGAFHSFAYRNYVQPLDFALTGFIVGGIWKFKMGPRGMFVGGATAAALGLVTGCIIYIAFWASDVTVPELRYWKANAVLRTDAGWRGKKRTMMREDSKMSDTVSPEEEAMFSRDDELRELKNRQLLIDQAKKPDVVSPKDVNNVVNDTKNLVEEKKVITVVK